MQPHVNRTRGDGGVIVSAAILIATTLYLIDSLRIGPVFDVNGVPQAAFFPLALAVATYAATLPILIKALREGRRARADSPAASLLNPVLFVLATALYVFTFGAIGYVPATLIYVYVLMSIFKYKDGYSLKGQSYRLAAAVLITVVSYLFFTLIFKVRLPGLMEGL